MEAGLGAMGLTSAEFWGQTLPEWRARLRGFGRFHGGAAPGDKPKGPRRMTEARARALVDDWNARRGVSGAD